MNNVLIIIGFLFFTNHFLKGKSNKIFKEESSVFNGYIQKENDTLFEFRRGDIMVKPNHNWIPGTSIVFGGKGFGHVAIVLKGGKGRNLNELLQKVVIFESHARDVSAGMQVREYPCLVDSTDFRFSNMTFGPHNQGHLYLLRADLTEHKIDRILKFVENQNDSQSCWRARKKFASGETEINPIDERWYCSLLIWQAFYDVLGIDLDTNGGVMVYPNDIINSCIFDNDSKNLRRVKF